MLEDKIVSENSGNRASTTKTHPLLPLTKPALWVLIISITLGVFIHTQVDPQWREHKTTYQVYENDMGELTYVARGIEQLIPLVIPYEDSPLKRERLDQLKDEIPAKAHWVQEEIIENGVKTTRYSYIEAKFHFGFWSLLPAIVSVALCLITKEPLTALLGGIVAGSFMLGRFDITDAVLIPSLANQSSAAILLLYLWLLGGLMGIWSKTGATQAFADFMTQHFVRGPRSAKMVAWSLGIFFFQGGSISTVLVGTTVKPLADKAKISHEEMSYIVDSTASPISSIIAFNAWPAYVQAFIFVPGVTFLASEADRIAFFFKSIPFSFYSIFAVLGTFMLSMEITKFSGKGIRRARQRAKDTGELDAPGSSPLSAPELHKSSVPDGYTPNVLEFLVPLVLLIGIAVGTFIYSGIPQVNWAFGCALVVSFTAAIFKGMSLNNVIDGFGNGLKGVVLASVILMLAITVGTISKEAGGGMYLVELLGQHLAFWALPVCLLVLTMVTAFSTGTSFGTYAIIFPLAMPLAWAVAGAQALDNPEIYMAICFAAVLNGSVYGDQCSPISDTTILSSMTTGCDLMDHVKTQIIPATYAGLLAAILWTISTFIFA